MSHWKASKKQLRGTGLVVGIAFAVLGLAQLIFHGKLQDPPAIYVIFSLSAALVLLGLIAPAVLRPFHFVWMNFAEGLGWVMNRVILGVIFFVVFTLFAVVMRIFGRDALARDFSKRRDSYWEPRETEPPPPERYERQF